MCVTVVECTQVFLSVSEFVRVCQRLPELGGVCPSVSLSSGQDDFKAKQNLQSNRLV